MHYEISVKEINTKEINMVEELCLCQFFSEDNTNFRHW